MTLQDLQELTQRKPAGLEELSDRLVFADGPEDARLMIIGEAPGAEEDEQGIPFVGRAGQLLDQILSTVNMSRADIYVTNIVKFRPPANRNPTPAELEASMPVLLEQVRLVNPQIIVPLGNVPTQFILGTKEGITRLRGEWAEWQGIRVLPMFHPAYLLRNPSRTQGSPKWLTWQDAQELKKALDGLGPKPLRSSVSSDVQETLF